MAQYGWTIEQLAGLILHNSAEFVSGLFSKAVFCILSPVWGLSLLPHPSSLLPSAQCQVRIHKVCGDGGGSGDGGWGVGCTTCTNEDSSAGKPRAHLHLTSGMGWRMDMAGRGGKRLRRSTWSSGCRGGSEQLWPAPAGPGRCSDRTHGCPRHCNEENFFRIHLRLWIM